MAFEVVPEGLRVKSKLSESLHYWSTFEELSESGGYWLFVLLGTAVVLPKRFFPTSEAERAFIAAAWRHLDDIARSRSTKTASYLASAA